MLKITICTILVFSLLTAFKTSHAGAEDFKKGPVITNYGENAVVKNGLLNAEQQSFKVLFDVSEQSTNAEPSRSLNTVARFINMHARAGVARNNINVAIVVHGKATFDLLSNAAHKKRFAVDNQNIELLEELMQAGVDVVLCGQSAAYSNVSEQELTAGVKVSLSAMTANALYQQQGYTLNPF